MKKISLFILSAFLVSVLSSKSARCQSACNGTLFGIPVCTGFCLDKQDDVKKKERVKRLRHEADSLNKEANKLSDSLKGDINIQLDPNPGLGFTNSQPWNFQLSDSSIFGNTTPFFGQVPPLENNFPEYRFYDRNLPFNYQIPEQVVPYQIIPKEKSNPMKNFDGWYIKKLDKAELQK